MSLSQRISNDVRSIFPGVAIAALLAMAAQFLSEHYGAPVMLMAVLLAMPFNFLSREAHTQQGINFTAKHLLRIGVALLGFRISADLFVGIGVANVALVICATIVTILFALLVGPMFKRDRHFSFLTGGAVAICGASAAMAIASLLPKTETQERDLSFTVVAVTLASTLAMIAYPIFLGWTDFSSQQTGVFLGATIHDVAQVVGAGYSVSDEVGDTSTLIKLLRVALLAPIIFIAALIIRSDTKNAEKPALLPGFVIAFLIFAALNSFGLIPTEAREVADHISRAFLVMAVASVGVKTSIEELRTIGGSAVLMIGLFTAFIGLFVAGGLWLLGN